MKHPLPGYTARGQEFIKLLPERILVIDGAMGTMIQHRNLTAEDFGGPELEGCNENLVLTRPDVVRSIHEAYFEAGADIVETNTFGGTPVVLAEYGLGDRGDQLNGRAAGRPRGGGEVPRARASSRARSAPTTKTITVTGGITFDELSRTSATQAAALLRGRRRLSPHRDLAGHPQREGGAPRHRARPSEIGRASPL